MSAPTPKVSVEPQRSHSLSSASSPAEGDVGGDHEHRHPPPPPQHPPPPPLIATLGGGYSSGRGLPPPPHPGRVLRPARLDLVRHEDICVGVSDDRDIQTHDYDSVAMSPLQPRHRQAQRPSWAMSIYYKHFPQWLKTKRRFRTASVESDISGGARIATNPKNSRTKRHRADSDSDSDADSENDHLEHIYSSWRVRCAARLDVALEAAWVSALVLRGVFFDVPLGSFAAWVWIVQLLAHSIRLTSFFQRHVFAVCTYTRVISFAHVLSWELLVFYEIALASNTLGFALESPSRFGWHNNARVAFISRALIDGDLGRTLPLLVNVVVLSRTPSVKDVAIGDYLSGKRARRAFSYVARIVLPTTLTLAYIFAFPGASSLFDADTDMRSRFELCLPTLVGCIAVAYFAEFLISTPHLLPVKIDATRGESDMDRQATFTDLNHAHPHEAVPTVSPSMSMCSRSSRSIEVAYSRNGDATAAANRKKKWSCFDLPRRKGGASYSASASGGCTPMYQTHGAAAGRGLQGPSYTAG